MNLESFRKSKNLSQTQFAELIGLKQQNYSRLIKQNTILPIENAIKLLSSFNITLNTIYSEYIANPNPNADILDKINNLTEEQKQIVLKIIDSYIN